MPNPSSLSLAEAQKVYSVSELTHELKGLLEGRYPDLWVRGEVANYRPHASGHAYFSLKDASSILSSVIFRFAEKKSVFKVDLEDGMEIVAHGRLNLYEPRGNYSFIVDFLQPVGVGALLLEFEKLKQRLQKEGLFDPARKRPLPELPQRIGIVTSPTGAAVRDILTVLRRRFANVHVLIAPAKVQGEGAAEEIAAAIREMNERDWAEVLIVGRGGGSLEDLWAFNEEVVARAIFESKIPVISAVGHEIDTTIADFVADVRAPTPSAAAEMVIRSKIELEEKMGGLDIRLARAMKNLLATNLARLQQALRVLTSPERRVEDFLLRLDDVSARMDNAAVWLLTQHESHLKELARALTLLSPTRRLLQAGIDLSRLDQRLDASSETILAAKAQAVERHGALLESLSPLSILKRGYSITYRLPQRAILTQAKQTRKGEKVEVRLWDGELTCEIIRDPRQGRLI
ncbi:MAG: exodeoxyribonuclease VII large subunit [Nitrospirae bacterium]|nr:exodeoxyribonuclease VII large subunit [Nitrospirota bacterium]